MSIQIIEADWPAPASVRAITTTRRGGVSQDCYASFNLADHVGDDADHVQQNRGLLRQRCQLPAEPAWLQQCHGDVVVGVTHAMPRADASTSSQVNEVCAVLTADCLPLLMCDNSGTQVAAVHAGWKGLHAGIISRAVAAFDCEPAQLLVWLGPAIGPQAFEVGQDVFIAFTRKNPATVAAFTQTDASHWLCDIYRLARLELHALNVAAIYGGELCSFSDAERFYSYRRDGQTGRMASLIWLTPQA